YYDPRGSQDSARRSRLMAMLEEAALRPFPPEGAYYVMADCSPFGQPDDVAMAMWLVKEIGVAVVPGSSFYPAGDPSGRQRIRFAFPKRLPTLEAAGQRLSRLAEVSRG